MLKEANLPRIAEVAARECVRQGVEDIGHLIYLINALFFLRALPVHHFDETVIKIAAEHIEPHRNFVGEYRQVPAYFADMSFAVDPSSLPDAMERLVSFTSSLDLSDAEAVDKWLKELLEIHPFADGNGRLAWVLRTWLLDQWDNPQPLPDYFGEK